MLENANLNMTKPKNIHEVGEMADTLMQSCVKCKHPRLMHSKEDHRDKSRQRNVMDGLGECQTCKSKGMLCKQFVSPK